MSDSKLEELASLIQSSKQDTPYTVLLGSSLSMTSALLQALNCEDWGAFDKLMRGRSPNEQYNLLRQPLNNLDQQTGYRCLAQLLKARYFTILLTANFDANLEHALQTVGLTNDDMDLLVVGEQIIERIVSAFEQPQPRIKICLLRGRLSSRTIPNASQTLDFDSQLARMLETYLKRDTIVLGANSRDFDIFRTIPSKGGSLWYITPESTPFDYSIKTLQQARFGETITGEDADFNSFFSRLAELLTVQEAEPAKASIPTIEAFSGGVQPSRELSVDQSPQVSIDVLYTYLPSGVMHLYDRQTEPLLKYKIFNNTDRPIEFLLESYIEDFSSHARDQVNVPPKAERPFYQLPVLNPDKSKTVTETRKAVLHTYVKNMEKNVQNPDIYKDFDVYLMARNVIRWAVQDVAKGSGYIPLLDHIAAWVTPHHPSVEDALRDAADYPPHYFDGYLNDPDPTSVQDQIRAIYRMLQEKVQLAYIPDYPFIVGPKNGEERQIVRLPSESLKRRSANCIDGAVLYASLIERASLEPVIVFQKDHAFVGWKTAAGVKSYEFIDTTVTRDVSFEDALDRGAEKYRQLVDEGWFNREIFDPAGFAHLLDIKTLRDRGISPME